MSSTNNRDSAQGSMLGNAEILVEPQVLVAKSGEISEKRRVMANAFDALGRNVSSTVSFWSGEAGDTFRSVFAGYSDEIEEILARLQEHVTDLNQMAGVYETTERKVTEEVQSLPDDVII